MGDIPVKNFFPKFVFPVCLSQICVTTGLRSFNLSVSERSDFASLLSFIHYAADVERPLKK